MWGFVMSKARFTGAGLVAFSLIWIGCSRPTLNLESDESYRKSLTEMRASLETEQEREVLSEALQHLRAWRSQEHRELMDVPALTPSQQERLKELELQHEIKVYEMLHGKGVDEIAEVYKELVVSNMESWASTLEGRKELYQEVADIQVEVEDLPSYKQLSPRIEFRSRDVKLLLRNGSGRTIEGSSFLSVVCTCSVQACAEDTVLKFLALKVKHDIEPGYEIELEEHQLARSKSEEELSGVEPDALACYLGHVTVAGKTILEESESVYLSNRPAEEIAEVNRQIQEHNERLEEMRAREFDFEALLAHFEEAEQGQEELERRLAGEEV